MKKATIETSMGTITVELDDERAPATVENFVKYAADGFYDGTIFHRVIDGFMVQGGGFTRDMNQKDTRGPIRIESMNGLKNLRGTIAMARTMVPDSATSQFFINLVDNGFLDFTAPTQSGYGYAVSHRQGAHRLLRSPPERARGAGGDQEGYRSLTLDFRREKSYNTE